MRINFQGVVLSVVWVALCTWRFAAFAQESAPSSISTPEAVMSPGQASPEAKAPVTNFVETGGSYFTLTGGFGSWTSGYGRSVITVNNDVINAEINGEREFGDAGTYFAGGVCLLASEQTSLNVRWSMLR